jgi:AcrR family transcriptional regulator
MRLFAERGYFATSVHDIRRESGLSIGSIYHHFDGKESIARALYDELLGRMTALVEEAARTNGSAGDKAKAVVAVLFTLAAEDPEILQFILHARHREFLPDASPICSTRPFEVMRFIVEEGIAKGELRPLDPVVVSSVVFGGAIRILHLALDGVIEGPLGHYLDDLWEATWHGVSQ